MPKSGCSPGLRLDGNLATMDTEFTRYDAVDLGAEYDIFLGRYGTLTPHTGS